MANLDEIQIKISQDSSNAGKTVDELITEIEKLKKTTDFESSSKQVDKLANSFSGLSKSAKSLAGMGISFAAIGNVVTKSVKSAVEYTQAVNLLNASMGEGATEAKAFAQNLSDVLGLNPSNIIMINASLNNLFKGFGNTNKQSQFMSKNLTQLSYDMAAFYPQLGNAEEASNKLRLAMAGTIEPLQRLGYALKEADLKAVALRQGYNVNIRNLDSATKAQLRYIAVMEQSKNVQGYFAKSFDSPTTAIMVYKQAISSLSTEIGKVFLPIIMGVMPYIQAFIKGILAMVKTLNSILGIKLPEIKGWDSTSSSVSSGLEDIGNEATKTGNKIKKAFTLGIDELNVLDDSASSAADSLAGAQHIDFDLSSLGYDILEGYDADKVKEIEDALKPLEGLFNGLATAFSGFYESVKWLVKDVVYPWLVSIGDWMEAHPDTMKALGEGIGILAASLLVLKGVGNITDIVADLAKLPTSLNVGITLAVTGMVLEITGISDAIKNGFNNVNVAEILGGEVLFTTAGAIIGAKFGNALLGAAIGAIIAGIPGLVTGLTDASENGFSSLNLAEIIFSGGLTIAGIQKVITPLIPKIAAALEGVLGAAGAGVAGAVLSALGYFVVGLPLFITGIIEALKGIDIWNALAIALGSAGTGAGIGAIIGTLGGPIGTLGGALIGLLVGAIVDGAIYLYQNWEEIWTNLKTKTTEIWTSIKNWFSKNFGGFGNTIIGFFKSVPTKIAEIFNNIKDWFNTNIPIIINNVVTFFEELPSKIAYAIGYVLGALAGWVTNVIGWVTENVPNIISSVVDFFVELPGKIYDGISGLISELITWASDVKDWITENVPLIITKVVDFFKELPSKIKEKIDDFKNTIATWATDAIEWVKENVPSIINSITDWFSKLPESMVNIGKNLIYGLWNGIMSVGSWLKDKLKGFLGDAWEFVSDTFGSFGAGVKQGYVDVKKYATGGTPMSGEMFFAREDGLPEMVGRVGRQTTVMNNGQIADTMAQSLVKAMSNSGASQQPQVIENTLYLDGEVVYSNQQKIQRSKGFNLGMGVFANV